ncbi:hypothetical protein N8T08_003515 [Aspergillus melleus]|uniref:Uncharacterized protein n=1 Tax=Aspergillus melleus TaxID=138277 RepID=A0ACC3BHA9_9EURO|nr:hypothetical protein N8T08_003515 [Aspergillus melleus]
MRASDTRGLSSPCSTDGITSPNGSPDTRITAFSPDDVRSKPRPESSASGPLSDPGLRKIYSVIQLSPTAASFTPTALSDTADRGGQPRFVPSVFVSGAESTRASFIEQTVSDHEAFTREYVQRLEPSLLPQTSDYEGQLLITVYYDSRNPSLNQQSVARSLETLTETFGDIKSFQLLPNGQENIGQFHLEFFNTRDAENVMTTLNRTSVDIMLRNIPNKIDQTMLKTIVDETSHGKYDFMYLRIARKDFANNCNVGYAFINFEDPIDIIDLKCRTRIFHTGTGSLAGSEDRFPGPDNPSKMRRSIENAEHVGLFAPRVGQQYRDEQRRRRSQYDRGTTAAEREIVYVRTLAPKYTSGLNSGLRSAPCTYPGMKIWTALGKKG